MSVTSTPSAGLKSINHVRGYTRNVDLTSTDGSVVITPHEDINTVDLSVGAVGDSGLLFNIPCDESVYVGAFVYTDISGVAFNALATSKATSNVVGIVEAKVNPTLIHIRFLGLSELVFSGLDPANDYMLSDTIPGGMMTVAPIGPGKVVLKLGQPISGTRFLVNKKERYIRA